MDKYKTHAPHRCQPFCVGSCARSAGELNIHSRGRAGSGLKPYGFQTKSSSKNCDVCSDATFQASAISIHVLVVDHV